MTRRPAPRMAEGWANLDGDRFLLDAVLPEQYHERATQWTGEQNLMAAALADAVRRYRKRSPEAERWFFDPPTAWLFAFENVCDHLDLDPQRWRALLLAERSRRDEG